MANMTNYVLQHALLARLEELLPINPATPTSSLSSVIAVDKKMDTSVSVRDIATNVVPLCSGYTALSDKPSFCLLVPGSTMFGYLSMSTIF